MGLQVNSTSSVNNNRRKKNFEQNEFYSRSCISFPIRLESWRRKACLETNTKTHFSNSLGMYRNKCKVKKKENEKKKTKPKFKIVKRNANCPSFSELNSFNCLRS